MFTENHYKALERDPVFSAESASLGGEVNHRLHQRHLRLLLALEQQELCRKEQKICTHLQSYIARTQPKYYCGYIAQFQTDGTFLDIEPNLTSLYQHSIGENLVLPGFEDKKAVFHFINRQFTDRDLRKNYAGAWEPIPGTFPMIDVADVQLILVPGVEGSRLVYSRNEGYDHWRTQMSHAEFLPVCLLNNKNYVKVFPKEEYDRIAIPDGILELQ